jgi:hypothetical protein
VLALAVVLASALTLGFGPFGLAQSTQSSTAAVSSDATAPISDPHRADHRGTASATPTISPAAILATPTTTTTTPSVPAVASGAALSTPVVAPAVIPPVPPPPAAVTTPAAEPSVAALVAEVEAAGIEPGQSWSWSMGDPATQCGVIPGNIATACTFGPVGTEQTVFAGSPTLALVAHELANAETRNAVVPSLMTEVATAEAGTSWSPTDAVASCLVEHFMGFQDDAAGTWQCPDALAALVADGIA